LSALFNSSFHAMDQAGAATFNAVIAAAQKTQENLK
jgi:hypothetical protein